MRWTTLAIGLAAFLAAGTAAAQKNSTGGKGRSGPASAGDSSSASEGGTGTAPPNSDRYLLTEEDKDKVLEEKQERKWWNVSASFETHRLIRQEDLGGAGAQKLLNVFGASVGVDPTANDHILLRAYVDQQFIADQNETGFRFDDMILSYAHYFPLKYDMTFKPGVWGTIPTGYTSQKVGLYTDLRVFMSLEKEFGRYLRVEPRMYGDRQITKFREDAGSADAGAQGALPMKKWGLGMGISAELAMPFHTPLSIGADAATGYSWYYDVQNPAGSDQGGSFQGAQVDPQFGTTQPIQQTYGYEVFLRYLMPDLYGLKSDISVAFANGDPSLGYVSVQHDTGISRLYGAYRQTTEVYASLSVRY